MKTTVTTGVTKSTNHKDYNLKIKTGKFATENEQHKLVCQFLFWNTVITQQDYSSAPWTAPTDPPPAG